MSDIQSVPFDFQSVDDFLDEWNLQFRLNDMTNTANKFQLVLASYCPDNINQCLTNGQLNSNVTIATISGTAQIKDCPLVWDTVNNEIRSGTADVTFNLSTNTFPLKAIFLRTYAGYVMGYSITSTPIKVTNEVILEANTILWSVANE